MKQMRTKEDIIRSLENLKSELTSFGVNQVGLFGSYLGHFPTERSDIDILIDFVPEQETYDNFLAVCFLLENIFEDTKVDIITKNGLSPYIGPKILREVEYVI